MKKFSHYSVFYGKSKRELKFNKYIDAERAFNLLIRNIKNSKVSLYIFLDDKNKIRLKGHYV